MLKDTKAGRKGVTGTDERATNRPPDLERRTLATGEAAADELPAGVLGDRYQVVGELGRGAYGIVYRARDRVADEEVAVKLLAPQVAGSAQAVERFRRELKAARKITHPGVVRIHDLVEVEGRLLLTMELVEGDTLDRRLRAHPHLAPDELTAMAHDLARALAAAHRAGVTHRDLKPANIIVRASTGRLVVADFGVSRLMGMVDAGASGAATGDVALTHDGSLIGTPLYMAPEQLDGAADAGPRADVYAFGVVLFELATGRAPHETGDLDELVRRRLHEPAPPLHPLRPDVPAWLCALVDRCLAREPAARPASGAELKSELQAWLGTRRRRRWPRVAAAASLALAVALGGAWWWSRAQLPASGRRVALRARNLGPREDDWIGPALERMARRRLAVRDARLEVVDDAAAGNVVVEIGYQRAGGGVRLEPRVGPGGAYARFAPLPSLSAPSVAEAVDELDAALGAQLGAGQERRGPNDRERAAMAELGAPDFDAYRQFQTLVDELYGPAATDWREIRPRAAALVERAPGWAHAHALLAGIEPQTLDAAHAAERAQARMARDAADGRSARGRDPAGEELLTALAHPHEPATVALLERAYDAHPRDVLLGWQLTCELRQLRRSDESVAVMRRMHTLFPDLQFGSDLATALRTIGRVDEIAPLEEAWLKAAPDNELALIQRVVLDASQGRGDEAARHARDLLLLHGAAPARLATLCDVLMVVGRFAEAHARADELLESAGADRLAGWSREAQLALYEGKFAAALDALNKLAAAPDGLDIEGNVLWALDERRRLAARFGDDALVEKLTERLVYEWREVPARDTVFKYRLALLRGKGACPPLDAALALAPDGEAGATARLNITRAAARAGCAPRDAVVQSGMLADESDMGSLFEFAVAAEAAGALQLARDALEKVRAIHVLSVDTTSSVTPYSSMLARYHLGRVLEKLGKRDEARAHYRDFLDHWGHADRPLPEVDDARAALARLGVQ